MKRLVLGVFFAAALVTVPGIAECGETEVGLRNWYLGGQLDSGQRNRYDVFGRDELPGGVVQEEGEGGGFLLGYRFGDRFLAGLQFVIIRHQISGQTDYLFDTEVLLTGTVLFRETETLQPFLRGGFGFGGELLDLVSDHKRYYSYGPAAIAGGGLQVRLNSRLSLELETTATFLNLLEVHDGSEIKIWTEEKWLVRTSNYGWRFGLGMMVWF